VIANAMQQPSLRHRAVARGGDGMMLDPGAALRLFLSASGLALLAACAPISPASAPAATQALSSSKTGGTLKIGITTELPSLESHQMSPPTFKLESGTSR